MGLNVFFSYRKQAEGEGRLSRTQTFSFDIIATAPYDGDVQDIKYVLVTPWPDRGTPLSFPSSKQASSY